MRVWWAIAGKELREIYQGGKLWAGVLLVLLVTPLTTGALLLQFERARSDFETLRDLVPRAAEFERPFSELRFHVLREPSLYALFNGGVTGDFPAHYTLPRWRFVDPIATQVFDRPLLSVLPTRDLRFVFQLVLPLLAVVLSFSLVAGEREAGTLPLVCSHPVSRPTLLLGKIAAGTLALALLVILAHGGAVLTLLAWKVPVPADLPGFALLHCLATMLWAWFFFLAGVLVSTLVAESSQAIMVLLALWTALVVVAPAVLPSLATGGTRYVSEQELYENTWPSVARLFHAFDEFLEGFDVFSPRGLARHFAAQPSWSDVAASLARPGSGIRVLVHSQGIVAVSGASEEQLERLEARLPRLLEEQTRVGSEIFQLQRRRFEALRAESERMVEGYAWLPVVAFNTLTARLAATDADSFRDFVLAANQHKAEFFGELEARSDFRSRRFFATGLGKTSLGRPPVWISRGGRGVTSKGLRSAWMWLAAEDVALLLAAVAAFSRREVI